MTIPPWKKWISYIFPLPVDAVESEKNGLLQVVVNKGRLQLCTENAIYSYDDLYDNFSKTFKKIPTALKQADDVLVLGLGLGSIPYMLQHVFNVNPRVTCVEYDEAVVELAWHYRMQYLTLPLDIIEADAAIFVAQCQSQYDIICLDIFKDVHIPEPFQSQDFLEELALLLRPNGILLYNCLGLLPQDKVKTKAFFEGPFRAVFPHAVHLFTGSNEVLCNKPWEE